MNSAFKLEDFQTLLVKIMFTLAYGIVKLCYKNIYKTGHSKASASSMTSKSPVSDDNHSSPYSRSDKQCCLCGGKTGQGHNTKCRSTGKILSQKSNRHSTMQTFLTWLLNCPSEVLISCLALTTDVKICPTGTDSSAFRHLTIIIIIVPLCLYHLLPTNPFLT